MLAWSVVLATGCGRTAPGPAPTPASPDVASRAQTVLEAFVAAARRGDHAGVTACVSDRDPSFADRVRVLAGNLAALPLDTLTVRLQPGVQPLAAVRQQVLGAGALRHLAQVTWRLRGEATAAEHTVWLSFVEQDGAPRLAATADAPAGDPTPQPIWWTGPVQAQRDGAVTVLTGAGQAPGAWLARARTAAARVREQVTAGAAARWPGDLVVEVPASRRAFEAVLGAAGGSYAQIAAVTLAEGPAATDALRIVVNPEVARTLAPVGVAVVVLHEAVHVATRSADSPAPTWLVEGLADQVAVATHPEVADGAAEPLLAEVRAGRVPADLPGDEQFRAGAPDLAASYAGAWLACRRIAERHGPAALQRLYTAADAGTPLDQAVQDVLGTTVAALTADWRAYLRRLAGG